MKVNKFKNKHKAKWGLGIGDWGLRIVDLAEAHNNNT